jgi:hypothetical protein
MDFTLMKIVLQENFYIFFEEDSSWEVFLTFFSFFEAGFFLCKAEVPYPRSVE